jgi:hypothetical protein
MAQVEDRPPALQPQHPLRRLLGLDLRHPPVVEQLAAYVRKSLLVVLYCVWVMAVAGQAVRLRGKRVPAPSFATIS